MSERFYRQRVELVKYLKLSGLIKSKLVEEAFLSVPREYFVPESLREYAYEDHPLPIGYGQTISAPHMVAIMTEELRVEPHHKVLEIGTGSGYQAAILACIVSKGGGHVYTIERIPELAQNALINLTRGVPQLLEYITIYVGDGSRGLKEFAPFDRILVTAAAPKIPEPLLKQLAPGGIMVIPVGSRYEQLLEIVVKDSSGGISIKHSVPCIFVPLIGEHGWRENIQEPLQ
ncbi:MAG: protein-L-isoaspartate(D-aspartate) O-methyltransferase [Desulfurococcaceae archaeon]|jgi:protein-L-isoaspartate(D-aspartate) O-methyltransferase|nr:protein-L-isoaspartate(D-aspartate) O-methyltransferase [Desulfurococcaceae archaeon]